MTNFSNNKFLLPTLTDKQENVDKDNILSIINKGNLKNIIECYEHVLIFTKEIIFSSFLNRITF